MDTKHTKTQYLINFETKGGIRQYFHMISDYINQKSLNIKILDRPSKKIIKSLKRKDVIFNGISKEFFMFVLEGGRPSLILHDPKLRKGFTLYELIYYILLLLLSSRIKKCVVHSKPDKMIHHLFHYKVIKMPYHRLIKTEDIKVLFFGRVEAYKAIHKYIEVFERCANVKLIIAGKINPSLQIKLSRESKVELYDCFFSDEILSLFIRECDYVIMPYDDVTNTNIHLQAFSEGKPVIRTNLSYFDENIQILKGLTFDVGNKAALEKLLITLPGPESAQYSSMTKEIEKFNADMENNINADCESIFHFL